jgi:hypothetical protein
MQIVIFLCVTMSIATAVIASAKGRHPLPWALLGFVFGIFALLYVAFAPRLEAYRAQPVAQPESLDRVTMNFRNLR